jgi:predicted PurR-regulated permease PerM
LSTAACVVVVAGLRAAAPILQPILLALFLAVLSLPMLEWLRRRGARTVLAISATFVADLAALVVLGLLITGTVGEFTAAAPAYLEQLFDKAKAGLEILERRGVLVSDWVALEPIAPQHFVDVMGGILQETVRGLASAVSFTTLVAVALIFALHEFAHLQAKLKAAWGGSERPAHHFRTVRKEVQRYLGIKTAISAVTGVIIWLWMTLMQVDFAPFWGLLAFLLNYVPVLGPLIAGVPAVLLTLVQLGWARALVVGAGYLVVKLVIGDLVEPHLMGRKFGLSTLVVFVSLLFWGWVWGPLGMILSVPLTMVIKIALDHSQELRWLGTLLGPTTSDPPPGVRS